MMQNKYFDIKKISERDSDVPLKKSDKGEQWIAKYLAKHFQKISKLEEDLLRVPTPDEFFFLQSENAFNAFDFLLLVVKREPIKQLYASTYSISRRVIESLVELHDAGLIEQMTLFISDSMIKRNPVTIDNLMAMAKERPNLSVLYAWSHAKVCLMETHENWYCVEGSGNWSDNAHYEQYLFANCKNLYDFRKKLFTESKVKTY